MAEEKYSTDIVKTKYVNDSKITDHYAIIPTGEGYENYERTHYAKGSLPIYWMESNNNLVMFRWDYGTNYC